MEFYPVDGEVNVIAKWNDSHILFILLQWSGNPVCSGHQEVSHLERAMVVERLLITADNESSMKRKTEEICLAGFWFSAGQALSFSAF